MTASTDIKDENLIYWTAFATPLGEWYIASTLKGVFLLSISGRETFFQRLRSHFDEDAIVECADANEDAIRILQEYFGHKRDHFGPDPPLLDLRFATDFEQEVWQAAQQIPYGSVLTYGELSDKIEANSPRAVGQALGRNRIPVFIPCHRIVQGDHSLGGFTGGVHIKEALLKLEGLSITHGKVGQ